MKRFDPASALAGLKDFQRDTVDYAFDRLYGDDRPTDRFLVADEVGLGKTLVARGIIAKAIEHLHDKVERIDVVYICSNTEIARQNIARLNVTGGKDFSLATRITLLPMHLRSLDPRLNFVSFTPGTSFHFGFSEGVWQERVLLYWLLHEAWGSEVVTGSGAARMFKGSVRGDFRERIRSFDRSQIDAGIAERFAERVGEDDDLRARFEELRGIYRNPRKHRTEAEKTPRREFVRDLRHLLATVCVDHLEPDLVILDEFQRFKNILHGEDQAAEIAQALFEYPDAKVLLLSATPYKMYTLYEEQAEDDHYQDLVDTLGFLAGDQAQGIVEEFRRFRSQLMLGEAQASAEDVERELRRYIARTERLAVRSDRAGMLVERPVELVLSQVDVAEYLGLSELSAAFGTYDVLELWKSAPYLLNFMEGYQLKRKVEGAISSQQLVLDPSGRHLDWGSVNRYDQIDPANPKLRALIEDVVDGGAWRLLWVPPSLPYHTFRDPFDERLAGFTKRLLFSSWTVVPKAVATLVSYEVERRVLAERERPRSYEDRQNATRLLEAKREGERGLSGMSVFALMYPSATLARFGDPLLLARYGQDAGPLDVEEVLAGLREVFADLLAPLRAEASKEGREDQSWYWAAPVLLDRGAEWDEAFWASGDLEAAWMGTGDEDAGSSAWSDLVQLASELTIGGLGRPPDDLEEVMAELALGGPAVVALRGLSRVGGGLDEVVDPDLRRAAASVAWGFRHLFNLPESIEIVRATGSHRGEDPYWRQVVEYCISGNLQAVLDEYVHMLPEWIGMADHEELEKVEAVAATMREALTLRSANYRMDEITTGQEGLQLQARRMRGHFALRFGESSSEERGASRPEHVRVAFNSPFWPFVLTSTSVGQEGLDFHLYCHAVVHWNLPSNPVDLEQREGRVHRYKGHAIRRNVAAACRQALLDEGDDPWTALFEAACAQRPADESELMPYWIFPGDARIERYVPVLPLSRDQARHVALKRTLGAYRIAFGQPRQEDLLAYLGSTGDLDEAPRIDLSPPKRSTTPGGSDE